MQHTEVLQKGNFKARVNILYYIKFLMIFLFIFPLCLHMKEPGATKPQNDKGHGFLFAERALRAFLIITK